MKSVWVLQLLLPALLLPACAAGEGSRVDPAVAERVDRFVEQARAALDAGRFEEAVAWTDKALDENPACLDAVLLKADGLERLKRPEEAFALLLEPPPEGDPEWRKTCLCQAAGLALRMGQPSSAIVYLDQALEDAPDDATLYTLRGEAEAHCGRERAAVESFQRALDLGGDRPRIIPAYAEVLFELEELSKAETLLDGGFPRDRLDPRGILLLGAIKCALKKTDEGLGLFREAAAMNPALPEAPYNEGRALEALGDLDGAKAAYRRVLDIDGSHAPASFHLGSLLFREGDHEQGVELIQAAIASEPDPLVKRALEDALDRMVGEAEAKKDSGA